MKQVYSNIELKCGAVSFGIVKVQVAPKEWLTGDPVINFNTGTITAAVSLLPGRDWITLDFTPLSYEYDEKPKSNKSGPFYEISLSGYLNNYDAAVQQVVETLRHHQLVAIIKDRKRRVKLVGNTEAGLTLTTSNKTKSGQQDIIIEMIMETEDPAPFYEV